MTTVWKECATVTKTLPECVLKLPSSDSDAGSSSVSSSAATIAASRSVDRGRKTRRPRGAAVDAENAPPAGYVQNLISKIISNVTIDMQDDAHASGASYWTVISDGGLESSGRYRDTYHRGDDGWRFATRKIRRDESKL